MGLYNIDDMDIENVPVLHALPDKSEAKLRIKAADDGQSDKSGLYYIRCTMEVVGDELAKDFSYFVTIPDRTKQEPKKFVGSVNRFKEFLATFKIAGIGNLDSQSLLGREGWALLTTEDGGEYGMQNAVKKWLPDR